MAPLLCVLLNTPQKLWLVQATLTRADYPHTMRPPRRLPSWSESDWHGYCLLFNFVCQVPRVSQA
jgi:hypothetical protein